MDYSQAGQDVFVLSFFDEKHNGTFLDIGCYEPKFLNNTCRLEENGWTGISIDILDLTEEWKARQTPFICADALECDYQELFEKHNMPEVVDYLSLDIEGNGLRYRALEKVFESNREFKVITIEHDIYRGYQETEMVQQRKFLTEKGYFLLCSKVKLTNNPFEDWWINPKYINKENYEHLVCDGLDFSEILKKIV